MQYNRVKEIKEFHSHDIERINQSLANGWILLDIVHYQTKYENQKNPIVSKYIIARVKSL